MAFDEGLAQRIREYFQQRAEEHFESVAEKKMFGGLAFMLGGLEPQLSKHSFDALDLRQSMH